jgi:hypothetical protein
MSTQPAVSRSSFAPPAAPSGRAASAHSRSADTRTAAAEVVAQLESQLQGTAPTAIIVFSSVAHDEKAVSGVITKRWPRAQLIGCTTAGEFVERDGSVGGVSAMALPATVARTAHAAIAHFDAGVEAGIRAGVARLARSVGADLRTLDPARYVGIVLFEGLHMREEAANDALGVAAPQLVFVGGSAGDDLAFRETRVYHGTEASNDGAVLMLLEMAVPFTIAKTCSFEPTKHSFTITRADEANRVVYELDGRPALEVYATAAGTTPAKLDAQLFMKHPVGMMLDGDPWIRSPQQALPDGGLKFYCRITEGSEVHLMRSTDLVAETRQAMARAARDVGGRAGGAIVFNCILRRLELDAAGQHAQFLGAFGNAPTAGFHTYGESYLGHMNQTCTALVFA